MKRWILGFERAVRLRPLAASVGCSLYLAITCLTPGCGSKDESEHTSRTAAVEQDDHQETPPIKDHGGEPRSAQSDQTHTAEEVKATDRQSIIAKAEALSQRGEHSAAAEQLRNLLLVDPTDVEILFRLAGVKANAGDLETAVDLLSEIPADHPEAGLPALGQSADWCFQLQQYDEAEKRYRQVLEQAPQAAPALRQLAYLLNRQGRRHEAAEFIRRLCLLGNVRQDELHSLIAIGDAMYDAPGETGDATVERPYWPIGASGEARKCFRDDRFHEAIDLLHPSVSAGVAASAIVALYGRAAAEAQDDARYAWWLTKVDTRVKNHADYWAAVGAVELSERRFESATRALAEALIRDPTDLRSISRMRQALTTLGDDEGAERWFERWTAVHDIVGINNRVAASTPPDPAAIGELVSMLSKLDRPLEALLWQSLQAHYQGLPAEDTRELKNRMDSLLTSGNAFPDQESMLCGLNIAAFPMPESVTRSVKEAKFSAAPSETGEPTPARLENVSNEVGLEHTYHVESRPAHQHYAIYQTLGGGVAVLDYDLDGQVDLYLAQGGADPPSFQGTQTNELWRQVSQGHLVDVTKQAAATEIQYSTGVTAGDWNQDGFTDLAIANIGVNCLLINNGDGSFSKRIIDDQPRINRLPTSLAIADVTGDQIPDLVSLGYVDDPTMIVKPPIDHGIVRHTVSPKNFRPCPDQLIRNDAIGGFHRETLESPSEAYAGLGVVVTDFDGRPGNEIFVGNDTFPNRLWVRNSSDNQLRDVAPLQGCAYGFSGGATGAMGIAAGDFDRNGWLDIHITNYENENANLFLSKDGAYQDRNVQYGLGTPSRDLVGFGSQAIDYDNDGRPDLMVTNGHLDDAKSISGTYQQPPQLFCNLGDRFELIEVARMPPYWQSKHVGRGLATLDYNRDGKIDVVVTHIEEATALLLNHTASEHHWLQLQLVGTESERDSIGARVRIRGGALELSDWVRAGDGYMSHNEDFVCFGLGRATMISEVVIDWPSGKQQVFRNLPSDQRLLIVENDDEAYTLYSMR